MYSQTQAADADEYHMVGTDHITVGRQQEQTGLWSFMRCLNAEALAGQCFICAEHQKREHRVCMTIHTADGISDQCLCANPCCGKTGSGGTFI